MLLVLCLLVCVKNVVGDYWVTRNNIINNEKFMHTGGKIRLSPQEDFVNKFLLKLKHEEFNNFNESTFLPSKLFTRVRPEMENSKVFKWIQKLPKGASLHTHILSATSVEFLIRNITKRPNLYCCNLNGHIKLKFFENLDLDERCEWFLVETLRKSNDKFDADLKANLTIKNSKTKHDVWLNLKNIYSATYEMLSYRPVFEDYLYEALKELYDDNVLYAEFRGKFLHLYELNGTVYNHLEYLNIFRRVITRFKNENRNFIWAKYIYSPHRNITKENLVEHKRILQEARVKNPDILLGLDLVGYEDIGGNLKNYVEELLSIDKNIYYYFHAGETNWFGSEIDENLLDAVLLGATRISHALTLYKHPQLIEIVIKNNITIEICPISNQVTKFVHDLRNHPAGMYFANNLNVVICNDQPGVWGAQGLSYDWYVTYMAIAKYDAGLEFFGQLAVNSIENSGMNKFEKEHAFRLFWKQWDAYVSEVYAMFEMMKKFFG